MIAYLEGKVKSVHEKSLILLVGSVGYEIFATGTTRASLREGQELQLYISHVVKEDAQELYGFLTPEEKKMFVLLNSITGVGPKSALAVLELASPAEVTQAVLNHDPTLLQKVSGIGRKTAERIVLELKNKLAKDKEFLTLSRTAASYDAEVIEALEGLGYRLPEIRSALQKMGKDLTTEEKIKGVLKFLGK